MKRFWYIFQILICMLSINLNSANFIVSNYTDVPDEDLNDGKYFPPTLRSAIQNANLLGGASKIEIAEDNKTIQLNSDLPVIKFQVYFEGSGLTLEPASPSARFGLWVAANSSVVRNIRIQNFSQTGLVWQGSDGLIELTTLRYNNLNLNMNNSHRNKIGGERKGSFSNFIYGAKSETGGFGISLVGTWADSLDGGNNDNIIEFCAIGVNEQYIADGNKKSGIHISMSFRNTIRNNLISGNLENGIEMEGIYPSVDDKGDFAWKSQALMTKIENNSIGLSQFKGDTIPNRGNGVQISSSKFDIISDNYIGGNKGHGIYLADKLCEMITITNNKIGTNITTKIALPNSSGIQMNGYGHQVYNNIVSGNNYTGISDNSSSSLIYGNIVGLDSTQQVAVPNRTGISAGGFAFIGVPGETPNIIAGNTGVGIGIGGANNEGTIITNNIIGTNKDKIISFPNGNSGIALTYSLRNIQIADNYIAANNLHGISIVRNVVIFLDTTKPHLYQRPSNITIENNKLIGRFGGSGIYIFSADSIYIHDNIIENADGNGISIENDTTKYIVITGNDIGQSVFGLEDKKINGHGVFISEASQVYIGEADLNNYSNVIKSCKGSGIYTVNAEYVDITGNLIERVNGDGITITQNSNNFVINRNWLGAEFVHENDKKIDGDGILVDSSSNIFIGNIKDPDEFNAIYFCKGYGLSLKNKSGKVFYDQNTMKGNEKGGISLDNLDLYYDNKWYDDDLDADDGSNTLMNTPSMLLAEAKVDTINLRGKLKGKPNKDYRIDVYLSNDYPGNERVKTQGTYFISWFLVTTDNNGIAEIDTSWTDNFIAGHSNLYPFVTLLTTDIDEGCSGFSILDKEDTEQFVDIETVIDPINSTVDDDGNVRLIATITNRGTMNATNVIVRDSTVDFAPKDVIISKGISGFTGNVCKAEIPVLSPKESVKYTVIGKALVSGNHFRKVYAIPAESDRNPNNNKDTISLWVGEINPFSPITILPEPNINEVDNPLKFKWYSVDNAIGYHLQVSEGPISGIIMKEYDELQSGVIIVDDSTIKDTTYLLKGLKGGFTKYYWRVRPIIQSNTERYWSDTLSFTTKSITGIDDDVIISSDELIVYPNPSNHFIRLNYYLHEDLFVNVIIRNSLGKKVAWIEGTNLISKGTNSIEINTSGLVQGVYFCTLQAGTQMITKSFVISK
jgi:parallel beta-helix repeat protein